MAKNEKQYESLGALVKHYRKIRLMTSKELAEQLGLTTITISYWENGKRNISISNLKKIAKILKINKEEFEPYLQ